MTKGVLLTAGALLVASASWAQTPVDTMEVLDNADFTFTESQLDEDNDAAQTVSTITGAKNDPYLSEVGYLFSPMRFRVRAYDNMYNNYYMNGLQLNDLELGRFGYSMVGGMNDAVRNQEGVTAYGYNHFPTVTPTRPALNIRKHTVVGVNPTAATTGSRIGAITAFPPFKVPIRTSIKREQNRVASIPFFSVFTPIFFIIK